MPITPIYPVDIVRDLHYYYVILSQQPTDPIYTPPSGGFILNNETEYDAIVFDSSVSPMLVWQDILNINDAAYEWAILADVTANWPTVKSEANAAASSSSVSGKSSKSSFSALSALAAHGIANASAASNPGLPTNFNLVSGVLGIANGLNDANTAQNDLATKYNDLEAKFNSALSWLNTNKDAINALKTAGAA